MKKAVLFPFQTLFFALILTFALGAAATAKDEWIQVRSKNFNLVGNASEKDVRRVGAKLEQFRETFRQLFAQANLNSSIPTNVVVFKSQNSYKPFKPVRADGKADTGVIGYFQPGEDVNYITLSTEGESAATYETIFHEYVHFIVNTNFGKSEVPPWFNEGLAEYYSTFAIENEQNVKLGLPQSNHLYLLQQSKLIPLETLFKIDNYSLHQNGNHSRSVFYAESWALIHYLIQNGKTAGLNKFLQLALKNTPPETAFRDAFQMDYAQMEQNLRKYVAQNSYKYQQINFKNKLTFDAEMQTVTLSEADGDAYLGDLLYHSNRADDAVDYLQKSLQIAPDSSFANTALGMVKVRQRKYDEAKKYLDRAISDNQKNHLAFYNYAFLLSREDMDEFGYIREFPKEKADKMRELLKKAIALKPDYGESYDLLAFVNLVNNEQLDEAVNLLRQALKYQPGNQDYALRIAEIYARQDKYVAAAQIAAKIAQTADESSLKQRAQHLTDEIKQRQEIAKQNETARKQYEAAKEQYEKDAATAQTNRNRAYSEQQRAAEKPLTPEEIVKNNAEAELISTNLSITKPQERENQVVGHIQKIVCANNIVLYTVKTANETLMLSSKDFSTMKFTSFVPSEFEAQVGCDTNLAKINAVVTFQTAANAKSNQRGELVAVDFVPDNFRLLSPAELEQAKAAASDAVQIGSLQTATANGVQSPSNQDMEQARRQAMMQAMKNAMRKLQTGEKQALGTLEKIECGSKGNFFYFKSNSQTFKFTALQPQIRAYTPDVAQTQFGCNTKAVETPVVFTYKDRPDNKNKTQGEIVALEFVPKSFVLEQ